VANDDKQPAAAYRPAQGPSAVLWRLQDQCAAAVTASLVAENEARLGASYLFAGDLEVWRDAISEHPEAALLETATAEYVLAMLNVCQGQYRNGFKGLRLVLELGIQCTYLSANHVLRQEWIRGEADTIWATLVDHENGPLSARFCDAFFADLRDHTAHFRQLAKTLYRELSECIHGNIPNHIPLPSGLAFSQETFSLWNEKAELVRLVVHFAFALRYLRIIPKQRRSGVEAMLAEQLGHIEAIRIECAAEA
jgi:hypothetical protein